MSEADDIYREVATAVVVQAYEDYKMYALPHKRRTPRDWLAYYSAAEFIFSANIPQALLDPETNMPMMNQEVIALAARHRRKSHEILRKAAKEAAGTVVYSKPRMFVPDTFTSSSGAAWSVSTDPNESTAWATEESADGMPVVHINDDPEDPSKHFFNGLLQVAALESGVYLEEEDADKIAEALFETLRRNSWFRVRATATIDIPVEPVSAPVPRKTRKKK